MLWELPRTEYGKEELTRKMKPGSDPSSNLGAARRARVHTNTLHRGRGSYASSTIFNQIANARYNRNQRPLNCAAILRLQTTPIR